MDPGWHLYHLIRRRGAIEQVNSRQKKTSSYRRLSFTLARTLKKCISSLFDKADADAIASGQPWQHHLNGGWVSFGFGLLSRYVNNKVSSQATYIYILHV
jgi:hypothetical protein